LRAASAALRAAEVLDACDFEATLTNCTAEDFVYLDPPYDASSPRCSASFTGYAAGGFNRAEQVRLREAFGRLSDLGCKAMLSNADTHFVRGLYRGFHIEVIHARRNVNSDARARGAVRELVITNYDEEPAS
jgi:DNA adenine methylase